MLLTLFFLLHTMASGRTLRFSFKCNEAVATRVPGTSALLNGNASLCWEYDSWLHRSAMYIEHWSAVSLSAALVLKSFNWPEYSIFEDETEASSKDKVSTPLFSQPSWRVHTLQIRSEGKGKSKDCTSLKLTLGIAKGRVKISSWRMVIVSRRCMKLRGGACRKMKLFALILTN